MIIPIRVQSMREAELVCEKCREAEGDLVLRAGRYCVDPRLTMGILAMMYTLPLEMALDTLDMAQEEALRLKEALKAFLRD